MLLNITHLLKKTVHSMREQGVRTTLHLIKRKTELRILERKQTSKVLPDEAFLQAQRETHFDQQIHISILTPLYNTPEVFLRDMIKSVIDQSYPSWELCLCDASDESHSYVEKVCREMAVKEPRIRYKKLTNNEGISGNTNECIKLASGSYFALLDHDDLLHPSALFEAAKVIVDEGADFVYTDEAKFHYAMRDFFDPAYKPDFAKDDLRAHNYICHLTVYSRSLLELVGLYDKTKDGSQDHDMVLRLTEKAKKIVHIPKILYFWRAHKGSVSTGVAVKSYATQAGIDAVTAQLKRQNEPGKVTTVFPYPSLYQVNYALTANPLISAIIYGDSTLADLNRCIASAEQLTDYFPIELCIIQGNRSREELKRAAIRFPTVKPYRVFWNNQESKNEDSLNDAVRACQGEVLFFLHAETEIVAGDWAKEMLPYVCRKDVGAVGIKLLNGRRRIYSAGIAFDTDEESILHHMHRGVSANDHGYEAALRHTRNVSILAGTCFMVKRQTFDLAGGFRIGYPYAFADLCMNIRKQGLLNIWIPFAAAIYWGMDPALHAECPRFRENWGKELQCGDPYYNPNIKELRAF